MTTTIRRWALLLAVILIAALAMRTAAVAQGQRYRDEVFASVDVTADIAYGRAVDEHGEMETLRLDLYEPAGDTESCAARLRLDPRRRLQQRRQSQPVRSTARRPLCPARLRRRLDQLSPARGRVLRLRCRRPEAAAGHRRRPARRPGRRPLAARQRRRLPHRRRSHRRRRVLRRGDRRAVRELQLRRPGRKRQRGLSFEHLRLRRHGRRHGRRADGRGRAAGARRARDGRHNCPLPGGAGHRRAGAGDGA